MFYKSNSDFDYRNAILIDWMFILFGELTIECDIFLSKSVNNNVN